jgi:hypothetical protein
LGQSFEVRDTRAGFLWINNEVLDDHAPKIGASAFLVYAVIARHANKSSVAFPSQATIAEKSGLSERAIRTALGALRDAKLIAWEQVKGAEKKYPHNVYTLLQPPANSAASSANLRQNSTQTTGSQLPTNKIEPEQDKTLDAVLWLAEQYKALFKPKLWTLTPGRKDKAMLRLKECLKLTNGSLHHACGLMLAAMKALRASEFHMGENDRQKQYISWEKNLYKSQEQTQSWIERGIPLMKQAAKRAAAPPTPIDQVAAIRARREAKNHASVN